VAGDLDLYEQLYAMSPSPVVALNRAVAIAKVSGPADALAAIESLKLPGYYLYLAVRGHLLLELGARTEPPHVSPLRSMPLLEPERRFIQRKIVECVRARASPTACPSRRRRRDELERHRACIVRVVLYSAGDDEPSPGFTFNAGWPSIRISPSLRGCS